MKNYYSVLGLSDNATEDAIKAAYRALAKRWHPDKNPGNKHAEEKFREIAEAYSVLSDPILRAQHDKKLQQKYYFSGNYSFQSTAEEKPRHRDPARAEAPQYSDSFKQWYFARSQKAVKRRKQILTGMIISFICWLIFAYGISNYHPDTYNRHADSIAEAKQDSAEAAQKLVAKKIENLDSPYDSIFGAGIYDYLSFNELNIKGSTYPVIVCLQQAEAPFHIIRNDYVEANTDFGWKQIPDGKYRLRFYTGVNWMPQKKMDNGKVKGGFEKDGVFVESLTELHFYKPTQTDAEGHQQEQFVLPAKIDRQFKKISETEFFSEK